MDDDLEALSREELVREVRRLRAGVRCRESLDRELPNAPPAEVAVHR